jgi:hypothetical protein
MQSVFFVDMRNDLPHVFCTIDLTRMPHSLHFLHRYVSCTLEEFTFCEECFESRWWATNADRLAVVIED